MKRDIQLYYKMEYDPLTLFKIKNADLRNSKIVVEHRMYRGDAVWKTFVSSFIAGNSHILFDTNTIINKDFQGFILMYYDTVAEKDIIVTDPDSIITKLSE